MHRTTATHFPDYTVTDSLKILSAESILCTDEAKLGINELCGLLLFYLRDDTSCSNVTQQKSRADYNDKRAVAWPEPAHMIDKEQHRG